MNRRSFLASSAGITAAAVADVKPAAAAEGHFQLGSVTCNLLRNMDLETCITTLEKAGDAAIELRTGHKHGVEPSIDAAARVKVKERFARSKVRLLSFGSTCEFESPDKAARRQQIEIGKTFVDLAKDTGAIAVKVRPNGLPAGVPVDTTVKHIASGLHELGDYGQPNSSSTDVVDGSVKQAYTAPGPFIRNCHINELTSGYPYNEFFSLLRQSG